MSDYQDTKPPLPYWAYAAAGLCGVLPLFSFTRLAIWIIGAGGAAACIAVARSERFDDGIKMAICAAIVILCWIAYIALMAASTMASRQELPQ